MPTILLKNSRESRKKLSVVCTCETTREHGVPWTNPTSKELSLERAYVYSYVILLLLRKAPLIFNACVTYKCYLVRNELLGKKKGGEYVRIDFMFEREHYFSQHTCAHTECLKVRNLNNIVCDGKISPIDLLPKLFHSTGKYRLIV